jgi:hypothetical protein
MIVRPLIVAALALSLSSVVAAAQTPAQDSAAAPRIDLTTAQKQTIYQSVTKTQKNNAAPTGFRVSVGALVPEGVTLAPMPAAIAQLMPQTKDLEVARMEGQVVLVDPRKKEILSVITQNTDHAD